MTTRLAFGVPAGVERQLARHAEQHGHEIVARASDADELVVLIASTRPSTALVQSDPQYLSARLLDACDRAGVRLVALVGDEVGRRHAASLGLFETVDAASTWPTIEAMLHASPSGAEGVDRSAGVVIAVWGPAGAPGRTSIAVGIAAELAALGHSVVLADVDTHGAAVAPTLGILDEAPGFAAACRLAGSDSLTRSELERIAHRYESAAGAFWVLTGIGRSSRWPELTAERVRGAIAACRAWVDFTILDTSASLENDEEISSDLLAPRRNAATVTAVREADRIVAVGSADPVGLSRLLRAHGELLEAASTNDITILVNRLRASAIGMNPAGQVTQMLSRFGGIQSPVLVPHDLPGYDGAVLSGKTLLDASPRSPARLAIRDLVVRFAPEVRQQRARRGR